VKKNIDVSGAGGIAAVVFLCRPFSEYDGTMRRSPRDHGRIID
jgi:hypothetical protein